MMHIKCCLECYCNFPMRFLLYVVGVGLKDGGEGEGALDDGRTFTFSQQRTEQTQPLHIRVGHAFFLRYEHGP